MLALFHLKQLQRENSSHCSENMSANFQSIKRSTYQKPGNEDGIDMLSNLPDSIISQIISKLETKEAVKTSLLSSRYKTLWMSITSLSFKRWGFRCDDIRFSHFVSRVLIYLKSKSIDEFCLTVKTPCHVYDIPTWFGAAIYRNVKVLELIILGSKEVDDGISMPACIYTSKTLEVLEICNTARGNLSLNVPEFVSLPNLTTLQLNNVNHSSDESIRRLISGCSSLEKLTIRRYAFDGVTTFTIDSPTLRTLDYYFLGHDDESIEQDLEFELNAPALRDFRLFDTTSRAFSVFNLCSLESAEINVCPSKRDNIDSHYENVVQLIRGLHNVDHLWISGDALEDLSDMASQETNFWNAILRMDTNYFEQSSLQDLLDRSTESLDFYLSKDSSDTTHVVRWSEPQELPVCLLSCLKTISVSGFKGRENELSMIAYILKNAKVLKKLTISEAIVRRYTRLKSKLCEKILKFDQGSEFCEIVFS